jgi:hypothetical protein
MDGRIVREGVVAGLIGAGVVAAWFLLFDALQGEPFRTPSILWAAIFQGVRTPAAVSPGVLPVLAYTVVHVLAFVAVGILAAALMAGAEREPAMLLALVIFFAAFEVFFLALVVFLAQPVLGVIAWWAILIGNFLAAVSMLAYFVASHRPLAGTLLGRFGGLVREGLAAGFLGGAVVAVWFLIYDMVRYKAPLRTPALLGAGLFEGMRSFQLVEPRLDLVLGYTVLHFAAFGAFGILVAALFRAAEREPRILLGLFILFLCFELFFLGLLSALDEALVGALLWWNIAIGNLLAAVAMLTYFFVGHRGLGAKLMDRWTED